MKFSDIEKIIKNNISKIELIVDVNGRPALRIESRNKNNELILPHIITELSTGFGLYNANKFLRELNTGMDIKFENFCQYNNMILKINNVLQERRVKASA